MRVSTAMQYSTGVRNILGQQYELQRTQNQLSTGRRMLSPADDPIGALDALQVTQAKNVNEQYLANQQTARSRLSALESTLGTLGDQLVDIRTALVAAGNGTYDPSQRAMIAQELAGRLESIVGIANTRDASGNYVFSGFQATVRPFEFDDSDNTYAYRGDQGQVSIPVAPSINMVVEENGDELFMRVRNAQGQLTGKSIFQSVQDAITILGAPNFDASALSPALGEMDAAIDHLLLARTSAGTRLNSLDNLTNNGKDQDFLHDTRLSELQDLDYAEAISRFSRHQVQLEATQMTFKQVSQLSLFNLL